MAEFAHPFYAVVQAAIHERGVVDRADLRAEAL